MSTNPYVSIDRVIDTSDNQRRVVDFLHQRSFVKAVKLYNTRFAAVLAGEEHEGSYYADITQDELDINFILKENHIPIIINDNSVDLTIDKDNFPSCKTIWSETEQEYVIRVYAQLQPLARLDIPVIITIEANDNYVSLEEGMRGYTNAAGGGGGGTLASIAFDRDAFVQYFETLGNINDVREQMENFLSSVAYSFKSGTISADKFITSGNNLMPRLSSFEDELGRAIAHYPEDPGISNLVVVGSEYTSSPSPHGDAVLRMFTDIATGPFEMLINPYVGDDSTWINIPAFDYWFSYYLYTTSPTTVDGSIQLVDGSGATVKLILFSLTQSDGWTRFSDFFTAATEKDLTIKITINQGGINLYLDAIQLENKTILNPSGPTDFAPGGKVIIEGGNIRTKSISASDAIFEDAAIVSANIDTLAANKIAAGQLNTQVVTIGDEDGLMVMADTNLTFYHPTDTEKLFPRVELGKLEDAILPEDETWGLKIRSADGSAILLDENGLTNLGIDEGLKNAKVLTYDELNDLYKFTGEYVSVDGSTLVSESVVASKLYAGSIESDKIQTVNLAAESITANQLNAVITTGKRIMLGESVITAGVDGAGTANSTVRFWAGDTYDNRATAPFRITQDGHLYASQGTFTGSITGASGTFGGSIAIGSGESVFKADANGIYLGSAAFASAPFRVNMVGTLTAKSGDIGGWTLSTDRLYAGSSTTYVGVSPGVSSGSDYYSIWAGNSTPSSAPFSVQRNGTLKATSGTIGAFTLTSDRLYSGSASTYVGISSGISSGTKYYSFWAGNSTPSSAPFGVTRDGYANIVNANIGPFTVTTTEFVSTGPGVLKLDVSTSQIGINGAYLHAVNTSNMDISCNFLPKSSNTYYLGNTTYRWAGIWVGGGLITSSDRRLKDNIQPLANGVDLILNVKPVEYKMKDGNRRHYGFIAQDVQRVMVDKNIGDVGLLIDPMVKPDWDVDNPDENNKEHYMALRYEEFIAPMVQTIQSLNKRLEALEDK